MLLLICEWFVLGHTGSALLHAVALDSRLGPCVSLDSRGLPRKIPRDCGGLPRHSESAGLLGCIGPSESVLVTEEAVEGIDIAWS